MHTVILQAVIDAKSPSPDSVVYAVERENCFHEKNSTAPTKGINTQPAFASGTTGIFLPLGGFPFPLFCPSLPLPLSLPAKAKAGTIRMAANNAADLHTLPIRGKVLNILKDCCDRFGSRFSAYTRISFRET